MMLTGKIAIVTGGAEGIGRAIVSKLTKIGATVVLADITHEKSKHAADEINLENKNESCIPIEADVSSRDAVDGMVRRTVERFGKIDILVNNAGIWKGLTRQPFWKTETEEWKRVFSVNTDGAFFCASAVAPHMVAKNYGRIIFIGSATVGEAQAEITQYTSSKAALIGLMRCAARELGKNNITVNMVHPSLTDTGGVTKERLELRAKSKFIPKVAVPDDLTGLVAFLAGDEGSFMTAQQIYIDGGGVLN
ncbi:SDR family NAD(P)-dependent oxidoreductase [Bradyrhizobium canariense]|uniref:3-oxoacyl-[acyl-carrier protein] reductase/(S)-1-phenylethanol dehydrogenase n=1 Tax=Bradyrhizobium canariense TaxID=255045 RepID=A0A1H1YQL8_9BRAD|nr:SDR family NAD(P)-dependent oxidoreductase [Bradyrhizobium canariense]SDT23701.1 3-oxoacyl-[acyl-carrier protein] reductase/(S)-1-phenylethanol dehydrogenase [Bradyrhizobium canariense]